MARLTVLGIGNILMSDEGVGVRLMEQVQRARDWPEDVEFIDGGVGGLALLTVIEESQQLLVLDAADMGLEPGQSRIVQIEQVLMEDTAGRLSMHQLSFIETLRLCEQFSRRPPTTILAIQVAAVEPGLALSPALESAMPTLVLQTRELVEELMAAW